MMLNVASTHKGHVATKTEGRTVENELQEIKHKNEGIDRTVNKAKIKRTTLVRNLPPCPLRLGWTYQE
jgi:hypothetical protein